QRFKRKEDPRLIQGISHYADDLRLPGLLHCVFVRSPHANAKIRAINLDAAKAAPGVVAVITQADLASVGTVPGAGTLPGLQFPTHAVMAKGHVAYVREAADPAVPE